MKYMNAIFLALTITVLIPSTKSSTAIFQGMILTVGPGGTHPTIQAGVNAALISLDNSPIEIRVAAGTFVESITIPATMDHGSVTLSGGWNANFSSRDRNPALTTIDGGAANRVFNIATSGGELTVDGFTITNGLTNSAVLGEGSGLRVTPTGDARVTVNNNLIRNNTAFGQAPGVAGGGGIHAYLKGTNRLFITNNLITDNRCDGGSTTEAWGAGMQLTVTEDAVFTIRSNRIEDNNANGTDSKGVGVLISASGNGSGEFLDNLIRHNTASANSLSGDAGVLSIGGTGRINARRNAWVDNDFGTVYLPAGDTANLQFADSVVAGAKYVAVFVHAGGSSTINLTNLTIADNQTWGVFFGEEAGNTGTSTLYNSVLYNNGHATNSLTGVDANYNLIGVDPKFANSASRDYHLLPSSPAINAGMNTPPGTLGPMDLDQHARITGGTVDIGAYEMGEPDFALGFDQGTFVGERGTKAKVLVNIIRMGGFTGRVTVSPPDDLPARVIPKPPDPISTTDSSVSFKLKIKGSAATGSHQITFKGHDDSGKERSGVVTLVIR